jgi:hypothetical protein
LFELFFKLLFDFCSNLLFQTLSNMNDEQTSKWPFFAFAVVTDKGRRASLASTIVQKSRVEVLRRKNQDQCPAFLQCSSWCNSRWLVHLVSVQKPSNAIRCKMH